MKHQHISKSGVIGANMIEDNRYLLIRMKDFSEIGMFNSKTGLIDFCNAPVPTEEIEHIKSLCDDIIDSNTPKFFDTSVCESNVKSESKYTWQINNNILYIEDHSIRAIYRTHVDKKHKTVTNNIESVLAEITKELGRMKMSTNLKEFKAIIYRDTVEEIDGIKINENGKFGGFYAVGGNDFKSASALIK